MIQFLGVTKIYPAKPDPIKALDDISFEIKEGEFVFLVGHSGSGKTSILRQLIREELPSEGKIFFDDEDITRLSRTGIYKLRRKIGIVFQDFKLIEDKNAYENVSFAMEAAGYSRREINETVPYVLDIVNLLDRQEAFPKQLSGGEKQRVAIARAIANNPRILIADEPTGNLDPAAAWDIVQILTKINKWGTTVIMSTHGTEIVNSLQKRVLHLEKGKLIRDDKKGTYEELDEYSLRILQSAEKDKETKQAKKPAEKEETKEKVEAEPENSKIVIETEPESETEAEKEEKKPEKQEEKLAEKSVAENTDAIEVVDPAKASIENEEEVVKEEQSPKVAINLTNKHKEDKTETKSEAKDHKQKKELDVKEVLTDADNSGIDELSISTDLKKKLAKMNYKDVEDILIAGIEDVNKKLEENEITELAKAIKKFLTAE
jgi:cell division transport system ATP-binding protein